MKKTLTLFFLTICSLVAYGQSASFGVKGGVNFATMSASNQTGAAIVNNYNAVTAFAIGAFADFKLARWSIQPGVYFTGKGSRDNGFVYTPTIKVSGNVRYNTYYVQVPVYALYHVPIVIGNIFFGAGPYAAFAVHGKVKGNSTITTTTDGQTETTNSSIDKDLNFGNSSLNDLKSTDYGATALAGIKLKNQLLLSVNYDLQLSNSSVYNSNKVRNRVLGLSVGYSF